MYKKITLIASFGLLIDQIIKYIVCFYQPNFVLIPGFLSFVYAENKGVAFSMLSGSRMFIILASLILLAVIFYMLLKEGKAPKKETKLTILCYGLLIGGVLGNLIDRIIRGVVIDYVSLNIFGYHFPIFNLADVFITTGVLLMIIKIIKEEKKHS